MTNLQLAYTEYLEQQRHNQAQEDVSRGELAEKARHNTVSESQQQASMELQERLKDKELANARQLQEMKAAADRYLQGMKNEMSMKELEVTARDLDRKYAQAQQQLEINQKRSTAQNFADYTKAYGNWKSAVAAMLLQGGENVPPEVQEMGAQAKKALLPGTSTVGKMDYAAAQAYNAAHPKDRSHGSNNSKK